MKFRALTRKRLRWLTPQGIDDALLFDVHRMVCGLASGSERVVSNPQAGFFVTRNVLGASPSFLIAPNAG